MKIAQVTVRFGITANLGNYNSAKVEVELTAEVGPHDLASVIRRNVMDEAEAQVKDKIAELKGKKPRQSPNEESLL